jgi:cobalt-zinc-cadmium efflux system membrane fusion protein
MLSRKWIALTALFSLASVGLLGCGASAETATDDQAEAHGTEVAGHTHGGWWCNEHGVPEEECALCDPKLVADFKANGDWCTMHERPDSQCFACHPEHEAEYAAKYEAKYGKQPPKPDPAS